MKTILLDAPDDFESWRAGAKVALMAQLPPSDIRFSVRGETGSLFDDHGVPLNVAVAPVVARKVRAPLVPKAFLDLARMVVCHSDHARFDLLYNLLIRLQQDKSLLRQSADAQVHKASRLAKEVSRDRHKMKAFVRFRKTGETAEGTEQFVAWFEPTHHIVRLTAPFFMRRFAGMHWSILTPERCAHWDGENLTFSDGVPKSHAPDDDALEDYWRSYYAAIFNPARLKVDAMQSEMPKKYWKNLPEAELIPGLIAKAQERERTMRDAQPTVPNDKMMVHLHQAVRDETPEAINSLDDVGTGLKACRACPLWQPATQAVAGRGPNSASLMLVGEQPGDREDLEGKPFVGPAGQLLRQIMGEIGLAVDDVYITNAVKHFKFTPRGKRRIHQNPRAGEIDACRFWLQKEIELVKPKVIVALGASAIRGITGKSGSVSALRGAVHPLENGAKLIVTNHPSALLRMNNPAQRQSAQAAIADDLTRAAMAAGHIIDKQAAQAS
ncbi:UdgX family uracil-DNA binding protein [Pseudahrensia aquimaris]|uniref:Type-4 uracil-DNA glycosylase n=1 Tax=Pseudahrensia aquimaris TaxID=744461 RepID=A0ABW3FH68_9HYPH